MEEILDLQKELENKTITEKLVFIYDYLLAYHCKDKFRDEKRFRDYLTNPENYSFNKKKLGKVVGWTRGKGKTEVSIMYILMCYYFYSNKLNFIFNPSETKEIKKNLVDRIKEFKNWPIELGVAFMDKGNWYSLNNEITTTLNKKLFIFLPQISNERFKEVPLCDIRFVDEAQRRILESKGKEQKQNNKINEKLKNKNHQILLSGSPYGFNDEKYDRVLISTYEDMSEDIRNWLPEIKLVSVGFNINKFKSYNSNKLLTDKAIKNVFTEKNNGKIIEELSMVMSDMLLEIKGPNFKILPQLNLKQKKTKLFSWVDGWYSLKEKLVIKVPLQSSADLLEGIIKSIDVDSKLNVKKSHSKNDPNADVFNNFWDDENSLILIVVDRGAMGFNDDRWTHTIDFTFGLNVILIEQFLDRQRPIKGKRKLYYKLCSDLTIEHTERVMTFVLSLRIPWFYKNFNGENYDFLPLFKEISNRIRVNNPNPNPEPLLPPPSNPRPPRMIRINEDIMINAFKQIEHKRKGTFEIFAEHTYGDWKNYLDNQVKLFTHKEIIESTKPYKFLNAWEVNCKDESKYSIYKTQEIPFYYDDVTKNFKKTTTLSDITVTEKQFKKLVTDTIKNLEYGEFFPTLKYFANELDYEYLMFRRKIVEVLKLNDWFRDQTFSSRGQSTIKYGTAEMHLKWFEDNGYLDGYSGRLTNDIKNGIIVPPKWFAKQARQFETIKRPKEECDPKFYNKVRKITAKELDGSKITNKFDSEFKKRSKKLISNREKGMLRKSIRLELMVEFNVTDRQIKLILGKDRTGYQTSNGI